MQIISQEKDPAVGINGFEGVGPEWLLPQKKESLFAFWKKVRFEGGEREIDLLVHTHWTNSLLSLFPLFSSLFSFLSFFFSSCSVFSFHFVKYTLFFGPLFRAWQGPFYSAYRDQCFTTLPLNRLCLVWAYLPTTKSMRHSPLPDKGKFVSFLSPL